MSKFTFSPTWSIQQFDSAVGLSLLLTLKRSLVAHCVGLAYIMNIQIDVLFEPVYSVDFSQWKRIDDNQYRRTKLNADITQIIEQFGVEIYMSLDRYNNIVLFSKDAPVIQDIHNIANKFGYDTMLESSNCISLIGDDCVSSDVSRIEVNGRNANSYHNFKDLFMAD